MEVEVKVKWNLGWIKGRFFLKDLWGKEENFDLKRLNRRSLFLYGFLDKLFGKMSE